jgi:ligand-binding sensor protein
MPGEKAPEPYQPKSLLELISSEAISHLLTGYRERFTASVTMYCRDEHGELRRIDPSGPGSDKHAVQHPYSNVCWQFQSKDEDNAKCYRFDEEVAKGLLSEAPRDAIIHPCRPLGLTDMAAQIVVMGRAHGVVLTGQRLPKDSKRAKALREKICREHPDRKDELSKALGRDYNARNRWRTVADDNQVEELRCKLQEFADLVSEICQKAADGNVLLRQREFVQYCAKELLAEPPRNDVAWQTSLRECFSAFVRFMGRTVQHAGLFYGERANLGDTDRKSVV